GFQKGNVRFPGNKRRLPLRFLLGPQRGFCIGQANRNRFVLLNSLPPRRRLYSTPQDRSKPPSQRRFKLHPKQRVCPLPPFKHGELSLHLRQPPCDNCRNLFAVLVKQSRIPLWRRTTSLLA